MARAHRVICISVYEDDLRVIDQRVEALKKLGVLSASRSSLMRVALHALSDETAFALLDAIQTEKRERLKRQYQETSP